MDVELDVEDAARRNPVEEVDKDKDSRQLRVSIQGFRSGIPLPHYSAY